MGYSANSAELLQEVFHHKIVHLEKNGPSSLGLI
jgi:hypothetical protein